MAGGAGQWWASLQSGGWAFAAFWLAELGDADQMLVCWRKALDRRFGPAYVRFFLTASPTFDPYRSAPRFAELLRSVGEVAARQPS
jgi:hypothetical protein